MSARETSTVIAVIALAKIFLPKEEDFGIGQITQSFSCGYHRDHTTA
jgi:hypothetical protein